MSDDEKRAAEFLHEKYGLEHIRDPIGFLMRLAEGRPPSQVWLIAEIERAVG